MRAQFVRDSENPLDTFDIGRTRERRLEKNSKEIKELFDHLFPKYKISKYDILTAGTDTGEYDVVGWKITKSGNGHSYVYAFFIKYVEMEDTNDSHYSSGYYRTRDNIIVDEFDHLTLEEAKEKLLYWIYKARVFENINFERGTDPKDAMNLGDVIGRRVKDESEEVQKLFKNIVGDKLPSREEQKKILDYLKLEIELKKTFPNSFDRKQIDDFVVPATIGYYIRSEMVLSHIYQKKEITKWFKNNVKNFKLIFLKNIMFNGMWIPTLRVEYLG